MKTKKIVMAILTSEENYKIELEVRDNDEDIRYLDCESYQKHKTLTLKVEAWCRSTEPPVRKEFVDKLETIIRKALSEEK